MAKLPGVPRTGKMVTKEGRVDEDFDQWLQNLTRNINATTQQFSSASDTSRSTSVSTTDFPAPADLPSGLYKVTYAMWVTLADGVSSSLTFTASWTNNGQTFSQSGAAMTGNSLTTQQNGQFTFNIDNSTPITYALAYTSGGGGPKMMYSYDIRLSALSVNS